MSLKKFLPEPTTIAIATLFYKISQSGNSKLQRTLLFILLLNWRSLPGIWHLQLWHHVPLLHLKIRTIGPAKSMSIGQDPFLKKVITKATVTLDTSDWLLHLSNSSYAKKLDENRMKWLLTLYGPTLGQEDVFSPLAQTGYCFFREIPVLAEYEIITNAVAWDEKWLYNVSKFVTTNSKGEKILHCVALSKVCFKMKGGSRLSIQPARVLSAAGCSQSGDLSNWNQIQKLRKLKQNKKWLKFGADKNSKVEILEGQEGWELSGMECFEERRLAGLELVKDMNPNNFKNLD